MQLLDQTAFSQSRGHWDNSELTAKWK